MEACALVPRLQVIRTSQPETVVVEPRDREITHQAPGLAEHRGQSDATGPGDAPGEEVVQPCFRTPSSDLVTSVLRDLVGTGRRLAALSLAYSSLDASTLVT